jgi:hypothetical protein
MVTAVGVAIFAGHNRQLRPQDGFIFFMFFILAWFAWFTFRHVHPVYFDDNYLYWGKHGKNMILHECVEKISIAGAGRGNGWRAKVVFSDDNNNSKTIRFFVIDSFGVAGDDIRLINELQRQIRFKKPGFNITKGD